MLNNKRKPLSKYSKRHLRRLIENEVVDNHNININTFSTNLARTSVSIPTSTYCLKQNTSTNTELIETEIISNTSDHNLNLLSIPSFSNEHFSQLIEVDQYQFNNSSEDTNNVNNLKDKLRSWSLCHNITLTALSAILIILKESAITDLPSDAKTLLGTPRKVSIFDMIPGSYCHFGLEKAVKTIALRLQQFGISLIDDKPNFINLLINADGLPLTKSSTKSLWFIV